MRIEIIRPSYEDVEYYVVESIVKQAIDIINNNQDYIITQYRDCSSGVEQINPDYDALIQYILDIIPLGEDE